MMTFEPVHDLAFFWLILIHRLTAEFAFNSLEQTRTKTYKKINMNPYRNVIEGVSSD